MNTRGKIWWGGGWLGRCWCLSPPPPPELGNETDDLSGYRGWGGLDGRSGGLEPEVNVLMYFSYVHILLGLLEGPRRGVSNSFLGVLHHLGRRSIHGMSPESRWFTRAGGGLRGKLASDIRIFLL